MQKVNEGLYNTLEAANKIRAEAEADLRKVTEDNSVLNEKITHKDTKVSEERKSINLNRRHLAVLEQRKTDAQRKQASLAAKKEDLHKKQEAMRKEHERIEKEEAELRGHLDNAKRLRLYLNKHLEGSLKAANNPPYPTKRNSVHANDSFWNG
jgi:predicted  nucleic acid-binding Zn-ribbon protein